MSQRGKKYRALKESFPEGALPALEALQWVTKQALAKFDETIDVVIRLGVDAKKSDQQVRGAVALPQGLGKVVRVLVFAKGEAAKQAESAGADHVGAEELVEKILSENWTDFDRVIATPDMMIHVKKLGQFLGPRGLMPNPKTGTVTKDTAQAVLEAKQGKVNFKTDKAGIVHAPIGKMSFGAERLLENLNALMDELRRLKPAQAKGTYINKLSVSSTMGPGIQLDRSVY